MVSTSSFIISPKQVSFEAVLGRVTPVNSRVKFDRINVNDGGQYDGTTGQFTCSVEGVYLFNTVMTSGEQSGPCRVRLVKDGVAVVEMILKEQPATSKGVSTGMVVSQCQSGQKVYVETYSCNTGQLVQARSHFSGVLLHRD